MKTSTEQPLTLHMELFSLSYLHPPRPRTANTHEYHYGVMGTTTPSSCASRQNQHFLQKNVPNYRSSQVLHGVHVTLFCQHCPTHRVFVEPARLLTGKN